MTNVQLKDEDCVNDDYRIAVTLPNGKQLTLLVPKHIENELAELEEYDGLDEYGLNLVFSGHYL